MVCVFSGSTCAHLQPLHASLAQEHSVRPASIEVGAHGAVGQMIFRGPEHSPSAGVGLCFYTFTAAELLYCLYTKLNCLATSCLLLVYCPVCRFLDFYQISHCVKQFEEDVSGMKQ